MIKIAILIPAFLLLCVLECSAQQKGASADQPALAAAQKAFISGNWNPQIFEQKTIVHVASLDELYPDPSPQETKKELLKEFGKGPFTAVTYLRRPETLKTNGGESYCCISFLVFTPLKVAVIDSRAYPCPADKLPPKNP